MDIVVTQGSGDEVDQAGLQVFNALALALHESIHPDTNSSKLLAISKDYRQRIACLVNVTFFSFESL